jgi:hypothetical protein
MGFLAEVTAFERVVVDGAQAPECALDRDASDTATGGHFSPAGDDAPPLPGDVALCVDVEGTGAAQIAGYQDPSTPPLATGGEKRIYSRMVAGVVAAEVYLKADGSLVVRNALGELAVDAAGNVTWKTPLGTNGAATHAHGSPFGPTSAPIPGT